MTRTERIRELMEDEGMTRREAKADVDAYGIPVNYGPCYRPECGAFGLQGAGPFHASTCDRRTP